MIKYIGIYKDNPTAGLQDGTLLSTGSTYTSYLSFNFDMSQSESDQIISLAIRAETGFYTVTDTIITSNNSFLQFCKTAEGPFTDSITFTDAVTNQNTLFYVKVSANQEETLGTDRSASIQVTTQLGDSVLKTKISDELKIWSPFSSDIQDITEQHYWDTLGTPTVSQNVLQLDGSSYIRSNRIQLGGQNFTIVFKAYTDPNCEPDAMLLNVWSVESKTSIEPKDYGRSLVQVKLPGTSLPLRMLNNQKNTVGSYSHYTTNATTNPIGELHHFAVVYNHSARTMSLYIDGVKEARLTSCPQYTRQNFIITLGAHVAYGQSKTYYFTGTISDFQVYDGIALWDEDFTVPDSNSYDIKLGFDVERILSNSQLTWRYDNYGTADLLVTQDTSYVTSSADDLDLWNISTEYKSAFHGGTGEPCFGTPDSKEVWTKFDINDAPIGGWTVGFKNSSSSAKYYITKNSSHSIQIGIDGQIFTVIPDSKIGLHRRILFHVKSDQSQGFLEIVEDDKTLFYYEGNINDGDELSNLYCTSGSDQVLFSNIVISNTKIGTTENAEPPEGWKESIEETTSDSQNNTKDNSSSKSNNNYRSDTLMAGLIKRNQIDGLVAMKALLDNINASYPALKVTTGVIKTPETSAGAGDQVYYTGEELLEQLKANVDSILNGGDDLNLPELARRIQQVNAELNGGTYTDTESQSQTVLGFKNKEIKDVVRVAFTWDGTTATAADATLAADEHLDNGQTSLPAYTTNGQPIVGATGTAITFNYSTKAFSAAPYILDVDATKASGGIDSTTGEVVPGAAVYTAFTGGFKVFPTGTWTLETLPTTALLDNNEMQMVAYDQALQKIAIQIATDKQLIARVEEAIGEVAIQDAIKDATEVIDARLDKLEGTDDSNLNKVAVKVSQITGKPAGTDAVADPAETVSKTTTIASKAYIDAVDNAIKADIGTADAATSYDGNGLVQSSTVRGEINSIKGKMLYKDQLINSVKSSVTEMQGEVGEETEVQVTSDINTINETALVTKFVAVDSYATQTRNALNTFTDTTAPATYVAINKVDDNYNKLTPNGGVYTYTYSDASHPEVVGKKIFEEKISQIEDSLGDTGDAAYLHAAIVPAAAVSADSTTGVTAKAAESTHVTSGVADADIPVLSKLATEYLVQNEAETRAKAIDDLDDKTYDWSNIAGYDGSAKTATVAKTQFNAVTGAVTDATGVETLVAAGTAETVDENTAVYSDTETDARINAAKAEAMSKESADKTELLNRIAFATQQANDALTREIARLTAEAGDTILDPADGTADIVATVDGAITALDKKTADWSNIEVSAGLTQIVDANSNVIQAAVAAESAADANTKFTSKQYVDDAILGAKGKAAKELVDVQRVLDGRIDALESVTNIVERIAPVTSGDPAVTTITLSQTPIDTTQLEILVNGVSYFVADGVMTINNKVLTWDNTAAGFKLTDVLDTGETVVARYQYTDSTKLSPIA